MIGEIHKPVAIFHTSFLKPFCIEPQGEPLTVTCIGSPLAEVIAVGADAIEIVGAPLRVMTQHHYCRHDLRWRGNLLRLHSGRLLAKIEPDAR